MRNMGISIYVEDTNRTYHTFNTWKLALGNNNYISEPILETNYIDVPYRNGFIDASTALTGRPVYKSRQLSFSLGGVRERDEWDNVISNIRNCIHGRICHITPDNDPDHYWRGRVYLEDYDRSLKLGTFKLNVPQAEPYKYDIKDSTEPGSPTYIEPFTVNNHKTFYVAPGNMPVCPKFIVSNITSDRFDLIYNDKFYLLSEGENIYADVWLNGDERIFLWFEGSADVKVVFRGGSL